MAYNKRTWKGRQGTGLNKFSINGATPVTVVNQPDSITEQGDALSAGNLNDLEQRIADGFDSASGELADAVEELESADTDLKSAINSNSNRISNLEQKAGSYQTVQYRGTNAVPTGKAKYAMVEKIVGKSRPWNQLAPKVKNFTDDAGWGKQNTTTTVSNGNLVVTFPSGVSGDQYCLQLAIPRTGNHKYLCVMTYNSHQATNDIFARFYFGKAGSANYSISNGKNTLAVIQEANVNNASDTNIGLYSTGSLSSTQVVEIEGIMFRDLTLIFGSGNEPSTVAEAVALCPSILTYDAYGYSLVDTVVEGVISKDSNDVTLDTLSLPSPVTLRSAGSGVNEVRDELDVESGVPTTKVGHYTFTGTESLQQYSTSHTEPAFSFYASGKAFTNNVSFVDGTHSSASTMGTMELNSYRGATDSTEIIFLFSGITTASAMLTFLTGKTVNFELASESEGTSFGASNPMIQTEGGGTINTIQTQTTQIDNCMDVGYLAV